LLCLKNEIIEVCFDLNIGVIRKIIDRRNQISILENSLNEVFRLEYEEEYVDTFQSFQYTDKPSGFEFRWRINSNIELVASWQLDANSISVQSYVSNEGNEKISSIEYPLLDGIGDLSELYCHDNNNKNYIAHSYATGILIENPLGNFREEEGFRHMPYPESFSGASMQFFTYYCETKAGLYFAAYDDKYHQKWLNIYKHCGKLRASQIYGYEDIRSGNGLKAPWKFVITLTKGDEWYEACDLYKQWAIQQPWCSHGRLSKRTKDEKAVWLLEDMGACTFGISSCHDRTKWIDSYSKDIQSKIFHVLGPDWSSVDQNYYNSLPGGYDDWFPTRFDENNLKAIRHNGDKFAPFEFDFLVAIDKSDSELICNNLQIWPQKPKSKDEYKFTMLCPTCSYTKELHVNRDIQVLKESGCDAMYYDISSNNIIKTCMSNEHGHPIGAGRELTKAYREIYSQTQEKLTKVKGQYVPLGTEMMNEVFLDCLDFYQARANAQPNSALETGIFRDMVKEGKALVIPMFQYVYSGYSPLRMDGWGKLTNEGGDLIYHTIAKTYLWGGLYEINCEYSQMELIDGIVNRSGEHYYPFNYVGFQYDRLIIEYLRKYASLRTGRYNKYLAYGEMKRPPKLETSKIWRTYYQYNASKGSLEQGDRGTILLDSVITARYFYEGSELFLISNTTEFTQEVFWKDDVLQEESEYYVCLNYLSEESNCVKMIGRELREMKLLPKQLMLVENNN
jgi:hypothetical protein